MDAKSLSSCFGATDFFLAVFFGCSTGASSAVSSPNKSSDTTAGFWSELTCAEATLAVTVSNGLSMPLKKVRLILIGDYTMHAKEVM